MAEVEDIEDDLLLVASQHLRDQKRHIEHKCMRYLAAKQKT